jgi:hypothetical protein
MLPPSLLALTLGLAVGLPVDSANGPKVERFEMSAQERARFREVIRKVREIVRQEEATVARGLYCGPLEEVRESRRLLRELERAYENGLPPPIKLPPAAKRP